MIAGLLARIWPWLAGLALIVCLALWYGHDRYQRGYADRSLVDANALATRLKEIQDDADRQVRNIQAASTAKDQELDYLRGLPDAIPVRVVRLCLNPASGSAAVPQAGSSPAGPVASAGVSSRMSGQNLDYGPALYDLADQYDKLVAQVRAQLVVCHNQGGN